MKTGPTAINAGLTGTYSVSLFNNGNAAAGPLTLTDSVDGQPVTISDLTLPATVAAWPARIAPPRSRPPRRSSDRPVR